MIVISKFIMDTVKYYINKNKIIYFYPYAPRLSIIHPSSLGEEAGDGGGMHTNLISLICRRR